MILDLERHEGHPWNLLKKFKLVKKDEKNIPNVLLCATVLQEEDKKTCVWINPVLFFTFFAHLDCHICMINAQLHTKFFFQKWLFSFSTYLHFLFLTYVYKLSSKYSRLSLKWNRWKLYFKMICFSYFLKIVFAPFIRTKE